MCAADERSWAEQFKGDEDVYEDGAGLWEKEFITVPAYVLRVSDDGRLIVLWSDGYGLINPARLDLPKSLQAVVYASNNFQGEPKDSIYWVLAKNVRRHDLNDKSKVV